VETSRSVRLKNAAGLHARPCQAIVTTANRFQSELRVACDGQEVNGKSILELMTLCAPVEATLVFCARGTDADALVESVAKLVEEGFGEGVAGA
jgi:phosphotransferase system HPr (HPr) family protein